MREGEPVAAARRRARDREARRCPASVNFTALSARFSSAARSRTRSPVTSSGRSAAITMLGGEPLRLGARRERPADRLGERARTERLVAQRKPARLGAHAVDHQRGEVGEMLGRALDQARPFALALGQFGGRDQFAQRQDAVERRADLVRQRGERAFDRIARAHASRRGRAPYAASSSRLSHSWHYASTSQPERNMPRAAARDHTLRVDGACRGDTVLR